MHITVTRRGGLAGLPARGARDDASLTGEQRRAIQDLLRAPPVPRTSPGADRFHYEVVIGADDGTHTLRLSEEDMPAALAQIPEISL